MSIREYVDGLFANHQDSADMADFKEEICGNLQERIDYMIKKGATEEEAFKKATAELGDISEIADQIGNEKRKEVIGAMYMSTRSYMGKWHVIGYTLTGGLLALGAILTLLAYFASGEILAGIGTGLVFLIVPVCGFVFLGLTQETAGSYPMCWKRALVYTAAAGAILFGFVISTMAFFQTYGTETHSINRSVASIGSLLPFVLPGAVVLVYLLLTEKSKHKPWVIEQQAVWAERMREQFADPYAAMKFGLRSGALWIFSAALFIALGFMIGFKYSWLVFLLAIAAQLLIVTLVTPKNKQ